jgi:hypothetical protein
MSGHLNAQTRYDWYRVGAIQYCKLWRRSSDINLPVKGIVLHLLEDFVCFAHEGMILKVIA